jgi:hypothetical protein
VKSRKLKAREQKAKERSKGVNRDTYVNGEGKEGGREVRDLGVSKAKKVFVTRSVSKRE